MKSRVALCNTSRLLLHRALIEHTIYTAKYSTNVETRDTSDMNWTASKPELQYHNERCPVPLNYKFVRNGRIQLLPQHQKRQIPASAATVINGGDQLLPQRSQNGEASTCCNSCARNSRLPNVCCNWSSQST